MGDDRSSLRYEPALDGIRGVAVMAVLLFHADISWARGGYLGVSVFFTLSGYLITRLLLDEVQRAGRVDLRRFYGRRVRRLLPASAATLIAVIVLLATDVLPSASDSRRQVGAAALQLANWAQLTSTRSYADLFGPLASPVDHFWSLAVEEQFYLLWPLLFAALAVSSSRTIRQSVVGLFVLSIAAAPLIATRFGTDAAYFATPSRFAEILAGAALAVVLDGRRVPRWCRVAAIAASAAVVAAMVLTPTDHGWAYHGGLPVFALLSATVVAGALVGGPVRSALSWRPIVLLGTISYSIYLVHWPLYLVVDEQLPELGPSARIVVKLAATLVAAIALAALVERPVRSTPLRSWTLPVGLVVVAATFAAAVVILTPDPTPAFGVTTDRPRQSDSVSTTTSAVDGSTPTGSTAPAPDPIRIMLVGDSTGDVVGGGLVEWSNAHPELARVEVRSIPACGLVSGGSYRSFLNDNRRRCDRATREEIPAALKAIPPDVLVIMISLADTWARAWDDGPLLLATDATYAAHIRDDYNSFFDAAAAAGVPHVVWLRPPMTGAEVRYHDPSFLDGSQEVIEQVVHDAVVRHPGMLTVVDFRSWFETTPLATDQAVRPDGVHLNPVAARKVADDFLGPAILSVARSKGTAPSALG